jgi:hypothetical protein
MHAALAVSAATADRDRGIRLTLLARALDRIDSRDSSRVAYEQAATLLPEAGDWLRLRAAGVSEDSTTRAGLYAMVTSGAARSRIPNTEALARERTGDTAGAIRAYEALGARFPALRLRAAAASRDPERTSCPVDSGPGRGQPCRGRAARLDVRTAHRR